MLDTTKYSTTTLLLAGLAASGQFNNLYLLDQEAPSDGGRLLTTTEDGGAIVIFDEPYSGEGFYKIQGLAFCRPGIRRETGLNVSADWKVKELLEEIQGAVG